MVTEQQDHKAMPLLFRITRGLNLYACLDKGSTMIKLMLPMLLLLFPFSMAHATLTASVDRNQISEQDIISLTIRSTKGQIADRIDLSELKRDFTVLNSQRSSQINIINGKRESNYDLILVIAPNRSGDLTIPAFKSRGESTQPINIKVSRGAIDPKRELREVFLENEVSKQEIYVQERFIYTLRVYHAVGLDDVGISPIEIQNAVLIEFLDQQKKYETILQGVRYSVIEFNYAIVPESSGKLIIPEQVLTGRTMPLSRGVFRSDNRRIRTKSATQVINVLPIPDSYPSDQPWLPTPELIVEDSWADRTPELKVGDPATRNITLSASGISASQLPNIEFANSDGLKIYPDQPELNDQVSNQGIIGERSVATAFVPNREGIIEIPGQTISWWNTETNQLESSIIQAKKLRAHPSTRERIDTQLPLIDFEQPYTTPKPSSTPSLTQPHTLWPILSAIFALLWLFTLWFWWKGRRAGKSTATNHEDVYKERIETRYQAHKALQQASKNSNPAAARPALIGWFNAVFPDDGIHNLDDIRKRNYHPELSDQLKQLDEQLYGEASDPMGWSGDTLLNILEQIRRNQKRKPVKSANSELKPLYPF